MNTRPTARIHRLIAELGWLNAGWYALERLLGRIGWRLYKYDFVAQPIVAAALARGRGAAIAVRLAPDAHAVPPQHPRPRHVIEQRFAQGAQSLQAWRGEELAGFLWFVAGAYQEDEVRACFRLAARQAVWDFDVYVAPKYRFGPAFCRLWDEANCLLGERGVRWSCSRISAFNPGSRNAHARIGAQQLGSAVFLCCGRWQWMAATRAPYFHLSRSPASVPQLLFDTRALACQPAPQRSSPVSTE